MKHFFLLVVFLCFPLQIIFAGESAVLEANSGYYVWEDLSNGILGPYAGRHRFSRKTENGNWEKVSFPTETHQFVKPRAMRCYVDKKELLLELNIKGIPFHYKFDNGEWICSSNGIDEKYVCPEHTLVGEHVWLYRLLQKREERLRASGELIVFERPFFAVLSAPEFEGISLAKDVSAKIDELKEVIDKKLRRSGSFSKEVGVYKAKDKTNFSFKKHMQRKTNSSVCLIPIGVGLVLFVVFFLWVKWRKRKK